MEMIKNRMMQKAHERFGRIYPYETKAMLSECFEFIDNHILFWFNTDDGLTHLIIEELNKEDEEVSISLEEKLN